jgi:hypothetical protein
VSVPSDDELDVLIKARLALAGVDLNQLPETADPATGAPTRAQAMEYLRTFLGGSKTAGTRPGGRPAAFNTWHPAATGADPNALAQQLDAPQEYPSIATAWTETS